MTLIVAFLIVDLDKIASLLLFLDQAPNDLD